MPGTYAVYQTGRSLPNPVDANGASTLGELEATAAKMGYAITYPNSGESASAFVRRMAGIEPIVLEIAAGHNLVDTLTGAGEDAGPDLAYHYICVWGRNSGGASGRTSRVLPAGYWCSDGDNWTQNSVNGVREHRTLNSDLVYYAETTLAAALPYGALSVQPHVRVAQEVFMVVPLGWHDDATTGVLTAPNGALVQHGFRTYVLNYPGGWDATNVPIDMAEVHVDQVEEFNTSHGPGNIQRFHRAQLSYTPTSGVFQSFVGDEAKYLRTQYVALGAQVNTLTAANSTLESQIAALQAQIASLQAQNGPAQALAAAVLAVVQANAQSSSTQKAA